MDEVTKKTAAAETAIAGLDGAVVALSGGVDSSLLLALATRALPAGKVVAVTAVGSLARTSGFDNAVQFA